VGNGKESTLEVPAFVVNLIGRLVTENEALRNGLVTSEPAVVEHKSDDLLED
jgi:hypothetical protein